jgi:hypothetical protein
MYFKLLICYDIFFCAVSGRSHSWLSYGAESIQERLWKYFAVSINNGASVLYEKQLDMAVGSCGADSCRADEPAYKTYMNPCMFAGRVELLPLHEAAPPAADTGAEAGTDGTTEQRAVLLEGSGDSVACASLVEEILWPTSTAEGGSGGCRAPGARCPIDGVLPPMMEDLHFFGMSAYYYALDCVRELGPSHIAHWYNTQSCLLLSI